MKKWRILAATGIAAAFPIFSLPVMAERISAEVSAYHGSLFGIATGFDYQNRNFSHHYELRDRWKTFVGLRISIPPFTTIQGQYYFGKDLMTMVDVGFSF